MSIQAIHQCHNAIHKIATFSKQNNEQNIKFEYFKLLNYYCEKRNLLLVSEVSLKTKQGDLIRPDGIVKNILNLDCGYWESKANVDLEKEIQLKINAGYPLNNTLFQDNKTAILYQDNQRVLTVSVHEVDAFDKLLNQFVNYEIKEITEFNTAIEQFKQDLPHILIALREMIIVQEKNNPAFVKTRQDFLKICKNSINANIQISDVNEMLLQHILTEDIFISIFSDAQFFHDNNIAKELYRVENTFFTRITKRDTLAAIQHYYQTIKYRAAAIHNHHDKQRFLKVIYENFYKAYNPKAADRMGIVYTPREIVKFQIEAVEHLLGKHFNKSLNSDGIKILDPCTGTGTYICELIDYLDPNYLPDKYKNDIYANELGLLPYYIANLNIEYTYRQKMSHYIEFEHICWTDTLDNAGYLKEVNTDLFITVENTERIKKQNEQKISVIIGNPPYNANQQSENDNNKNRDYYQKDNLAQDNDITNRNAKKKGGIDGRIADTYIKESSAQKTKLYDMYARFYRWASDRINEEQGIIAFISNNSFIDSKTFDGFRKCVAREFDFIYIVNLGGDMRKNTDTTDNVFGIKIGVALLFLIKTNHNPIKNAKIFYYRFPNCESKEDKLSLLEDSKFETLVSEFERILPNENHYWINQTNNDFNELLPICDKQVKLGKHQKAIFKLYTGAYKTNRDEWVIDFDVKNLTQKIRYFIKRYNAQINSGIVDNNFLDYSIKWSSTLKNNLYAKKKVTFNPNKLVNLVVRPFVKANFYAEKLLNDRLTENHYKISGSSLTQNNLILTFNEGGRLDLAILATTQIPSYSLYVMDATQSIPFFIYDEQNNKADNLTDWAFKEFKNHYNMELTKLDIFHYVYAVLHNPSYREKYQFNLKRDFPRIPFYANFAQWANYGKQLMDLHLNYATVAQYPLKRQDTQTSKIPKVKLKADKEHGLIMIDDNTTLSEIPPLAWEYKLGNRSALEWVLDQYKERKPNDLTIAQQFNTYQFSDYKEQVLDLLMRVCTVSVETQKITAAMGELTV